MQLSANLLQRDVKFLTIITTFADCINIQIKAHGYTSNETKKRREEKGGGYNVNLFNISETLGGVQFWHDFCLLYVVTNTHPPLCNACKQGVVTSLKIFSFPKFFLS